MSQYIKTTSDGAQTQTDSLNGVAIDEINLENTILKTTLDGRLTNDALTNLLTHFVDDFEKEFGYPFSYSLSALGGRLGIGLGAKLLRDNGYMGPIDLIEPIIQSFVNDPANIHRVYGEGSLDNISNFITLMVSLSVNGESNWGGSYVLSTPSASSIGFETYSLSVDSGTGELETTKVAGPVYSKDTYIYLKDPVNTGDVIGRVPGVYLPGMFSGLVFEVVSKGFAEGVEVNSETGEITVLDDLSVFDPGVDDATPVEMTCRVSLSNGDHAESTVTIRRGY